MRRWRRWRWRLVRGTVGASVAAELRSQGDAARDQRRFRDAAVLYDAAVRARPSPATSIQAGHMFKEAGDFVAAEAHYHTALLARPDDADLALQFGHLLKLAGRADEAIRYYRRALALDVDRGEAAREIASLQREGLAPSTATAAPGDHLIPELLAAAPPVNDVASVLHVSRWAGRAERSEWGELPTVRGIEAVRGMYRGGEPADTVQLLLDGELILTDPLRLVGGSKHVFNFWYDFSTAPQGLHLLEVRVQTAPGKVVRQQRHVVVREPLRVADHPDSDAVVDGSVRSELPLVARIRAQPSVIRQVRSGVFPQRPRTVLVLRPDQLGDMVVSVPAVRRLRELLPEARIVGLVTPANADLADSLGLFDDLVIAHWAATPDQPRSVLPAEEQRRLRGQLHAYGFDVAIDLSVSGNARPLLLLSGAAFLIGFDDARFGWLTAGVSGSSHDAKTGAEMAPHSGKLLALVERFGTLLDSGSRVLPAVTDRNLLLSFGLDPATRYAVLHTGARFAFGRWLGYAELAAMLLDRTALELVVFCDGPDDAFALESPRVRRFDGPLPFAGFEALLSMAAVFVGNDSGPKHLAALRGTPVVSVHSSRVDWREWAQEQTGSVISRRVPCAGCGISADDECGKDYACIVDITPAEVFAAVAALL